MHYFCITSSGMDLQFGKKVFNNATKSLATENLWAKLQLIAEIMLFLIVPGLLCDRLHWPLAWASQVQALSSSLQNCPWHCTWLSQWALPIKHWRHCSFSTPPGDLQVPRSKTNFGHRAFAVVGPASWNRLPATIRSSDMLQNFKNQLKAQLFWGTIFSLFYSSRVRAPLNWTPSYGAQEINALLLLLLSFAYFPTKWKCTQTQEIWINMPYTIQISVSCKIVTIINAFVFNCMTSTTGKGLSYHWVHHSSLHITSLLRKCNALQLHHYW